MTLRIQRSIEQKSVVVFVLIGRIQAEQVEELRSLFVPQLAAYEIVLDLKDVMLVDRDAVRFLAQSEAQGIELRNCLPYIREWIRQEKNAMNREEIQHSAGLRD